MERRKGGETGENVSDRAEVEEIGGNWMGTLVVKVGSVPSDT